LKIYSAIKCQLVSFIPSSSSQAPFNIIGHAL
jgi:hypothetical protein